MDGRNRIITICFFVVVLFFGFSIVDDYGMSWDETYSRDQNGVIAFNYFNTEKELMIK